MSARLLKQRVLMCSVAQKSHAVHVAHPFERQENNTQREKKTERNELLIIISAQRVSTQASTASAAQAISRRRQHIMVHTIYAIYIGFAVVTPTFCVCVCVALMLVLRFV